MLVSWGMSKRQLQERYQLPLRRLLRLPPPLRRRPPLPPGIDIRKLNIRNGRVFEVAQAV